MSFGVDRIAVICSAHVNAVGIVLSLREAGWTGRIVALNVNSGSYLATRWGRLCEYREVNFSDPDELPRFVRDTYGADTEFVFFFTDERFLPTFASSELRSVLPNAHCHVGTASHLETVLDRRLFYRFVTDNGLAATPATIPSTEDPWAAFGSRFFVRLWRSWRGMNALPRGRVVHCAEEHDAWLRKCEEVGLERTEWGYQELLGTDPKDNVSVCGWHDPAFRWYCTTGKVKVHADKVGWLIEALPSNRDLEAQTRNILDALVYSGPFEMEFVRDPKDGVYKVIELNPRFWMQHRLAAHLSGNCLVKRYVGLPVNGMVPPVPTGKKYWIETDFALARILSFRAYEVIPYLHQAVWAHGVNKPTLGHALRGLRGRLSAAVGGRNRN